MILDTGHLSCEWTQVLNFSVSKLQNNGSLKLQDTTNYISLGLSKEWVESLSRSRSLSLSLSLCLSLSHTHTHTHTLSYTHLNQPRLKQVMAAEQGSE